MKPEKDNPKLEEITDTYRTLGILDPDERQRLQELANPIAWPEWKRQRKLYNKTRSKSRLTSDSSS